MKHCLDRVKLHYILKRTAEGTLFDIKLQQRNGEWILSGSIGGGCICSDIEAVDVIIVEAKVICLLSKIEAMLLSPLIIHNHLLEEGVEELLITNGIFQSRFTWDENAPQAYEALQKIGRELQSWVTRG